MRSVVLAKFQNNYDDSKHGVPVFYNKEYSYRTWLDLKVDDLCVVVVNGKYSVVRISQIRGLETNQIHQACKWIVAKIDTEAYEEQMKKEKLAQEIRNRLQARKQEMEEILIYRQLAKNDKEIESLLKELESLGSLDGIKLLTSENKE